MHVVVVKHRPLDPMFDDGLEWKTIVSFQDERQQVLTTTVFIDQVNYDFYYIAVLWH